jgi:hypothetical protein
MSRTLDLVVSVLLGVGLSVVFKLCCDSRNCLVYRAPCLEDKVLRYENKCYKASERPERCDINKRILESQ